MHLLRARSYLLVRATKITVPTNISYIQWSSPAELELTMTHAGRSRLLVARTNERVGMLLHLHALY